MLVAPPRAVLRTFSSALRVSSFVPEGFLRGDDGFAVVFRERGLVGLPLIRLAVASNVNARVDF